MKIQRRTFPTSVQNMRGNERCLRHAILRGEMRSRSGEKLDRYEAYFQSHCREIAEKRGARVEFKRENTFLPVPSSRRTPR